MKTVCFYEKKEPGFAGAVAARGVLQKIILAGNDKKMFESRVIKEFPDAVFIKGSVPPRGFKAPVLNKERITCFMQRVFDEILLIPRGAPATYGYIAEKLGDRNKARAVGNALSKNPFPIIYPCHRIVSAGKRGGGFSGGMKWKEYLLKLDKEKGRNYGGKKKNG
ncbi:MAG: methylated-DNA--[protein]-cysteine S-methyltransferase [Candidatus Goldiibacteriota bacterium]